MLNYTHMWRLPSARRAGETEFLEEALTRVFTDTQVVAHADKALAAAAHAEPLIAQSLKTPQSLPYHGEGPFMESHLRAMLAALYAVEDGTLDLRSVEEFARQKSFRGEVEELQDTLRENAAFFEAFILCHDAAKWVSASCEAERGSVGERLGFFVPPRAAWEDAGAASRARVRSLYVDLYQAFAKDHRHMSPADIQAAFFDTYRIRVHFRGHDRMIHAPVFRSLLSRVCNRLRLAQDDEHVLEYLIAHHLQPLADFDGIWPERIGRYLMLAKKAGVDGDDFIDLLQAAAFLDYVTGSVKRESAADKPVHELSPVLRFLESEHAFAPHRREELAKRRAEKKKQERTAVFREYGLDGLSLMDVLELPPGPKFGALLAQIHAAIEGVGRMPILPARAAMEIERRIHALASQFGRERE